MIKSSNEEEEVVMPAKHKRLVDITEEELMKLSREDVIVGLTDQHIQFCENIVQDCNIKMSAIKAGYSPKSAHMMGLKLRQRDDINTYICWLKLKLLKRVCVRAEDVLEQYAKMAFYDVTDYIQKGVGGKIQVKSLDLIDGQMIQEIGNSANGSLVIKFPDRFKALEKLENYMDTLPSDWKRRIEIRKLEILEERLRLESLKYGEGGSEEFDDGFMEAMKSNAANIFDDEEEEENE